MSFYGSSISLYDRLVLTGTARFTGYQSSTVNGMYTIFAYTTSGLTNNAITFTPGTPPTLIPIYVFAVAGGGAGGSVMGYGGGGGGAGGVLQNVITYTANSSDTVPINVGAGGNRPNPGNPSSVVFTSQTSLSLTSIGGGVGGGDAAAGNGGSGGGIGFNAAYFTPGTGTTGQGFRGGGGVAGTHGAGGGGAGAVGNDGPDGIGGAGVTINTNLPAFSGSSYISTIYGVGGNGGWNGQSQSGVVNTGGGGGGSTNGNAGGSGIVLVGILTALVV